MTFDIAFALEILPEILSAARVTIAATVLGMAIAATLGLLLALARRSQARWLSLPTAAAIEFVRSTPLLVQLFFLFYVLPGFGVTLPPFLTGVLGLGLHYSTYTSEVYRAGLDAIPKGQWEAAMALGIPLFLRLRLVIIPQAVPPVVPALGNYLVALFKETPLLSAIAIVEMLQTAKIITSETFRSLEPYTLVGIVFLVLSILSALGVRWLEDYLALESKYARVQRQLQRTQAAS